MAKKSGDGKRVTVHRSSKSSKFVKKSSADKHKSTTEKERIRRGN